MNNDYFYGIVNKIINDRNSWKIVQNMSDVQMSNLVYYLDNKLFYQLNNLLTVLSPLEISNDVPVDSFIKYYNECNKLNIPMIDILTACKYITMKAGANNPLHISTEAKNIILKKLTLTLDSVLNRKFDKEAIDLNLRAGAVARKTYRAELKAKTLKATKTQHPVEKMKTKPSKMEIETETIESYNEPRAQKIIKPIPEVKKPQPLSEPLDVLPASMPHASVIEAAQKKSTEQIKSEGKTSPKSVESQKKIVSQPIDILVKQLT